MCRRARPALIAGALTWFALAATGTAMLAPPPIVIRYAGTAYLLWLAWKLRNAVPRAATLAVLIASSVPGADAMVAARARRLLTTPRPRQRLNRGSAVALR